MVGRAAYALYRRSTSAQDLSIDEQRAAVSAWASDNGYRIVREFQDDASGLDTARRPGFKALLDVCRQQRRRDADVVLVYDVSRFGRFDVDEAGYHEFSLKKAGVTVIYTHDPGASDGGITGDLVKSMKRVLAHEYSQKLSQLVRRGHRAHAALGYWSGGRPPYGYRRAVQPPTGEPLPLEAGRWKARGERVVLVVEPREADVVRWMFEASAYRGLGIAAIARALNARGVPPPRRTRAGRAAWAKSAVYVLLHNPVYQGDLVWGRARYREVGRKRGKRPLPESERVVARDAVPAIVSREVWAAAQDRHRHDGREFAAGRPWHRGYLLSGIIVCAACGRHFQAQKQYRGRVPAYYLCGGYVASGREFCASPRIPTSYLEDAVIDGIQKRIERVVDADELRRCLEGVLPDDRSGREAAAAIESQIRATSAKIDRLVEALAAGSGDVPSLRDAVVTLERERARLVEQLHAARSRRTSGDERQAIIAELLARIGHVRDVLASGDPDERKAVVRQFIAEIRVDRHAERIVLRWYRVPRDSWVKLVAVGGIEPPTRGL